MQAMIQRLKDKKPLIRSCTVLTPLDLQLTEAISYLLSKVVRLTSDRGHTFLILGAGIGPPVSAGIQRETLVESFVPLNEFLRFPAFFAALTP